MRIYCAISEREAKPIKARNDSVPIYKCFPSGGKKNLDANAKKFLMIEEAAAYLLRTSGGGIRVAANKTGDANAILNTNLVIEHDDGRKEFL